jgi:2-(1,2-epoxy-1,2-dihydrophenyl)acetyl-CoA isomerase
MEEKMSYAFLQVEDHAKGVRVVTLNNPRNLNALGVEISRELQVAFAEFGAAPAARVLVIRGAGRAFSSGGNLTDMREGCKTGPGKYMDDLTAALYQAINIMLDLDKPVIAQVHGFAYGAALNLVVACDLAVAAEETVFCQSFLKLGLIPGGYATLLLPAAIGLKRTLDLCLTTREVSAREALSIGLISRVVPEKELEAETMKLAETLAVAPPLAVQETKRLLRASRGRPGPEQAAEERQTQVRMAQTHDFKEGLDAFFEKRPPKFEGK